MSCLSYHMNILHYLKHPRVAKIYWFILGFICVFEQLLYFSLSEIPALLINVKNTEEFLYIVTE